MSQLGLVDSVGTKNRLCRVQDQLEDVVIRLRHEKLQHLAGGHFTVIWTDSLVFVDFVVIVNNKGL